jgi:hypothetical protein
MSNPPQDPAAIPQTSVATPRNSVAPPQSADAKDFRWLRRASRGKFYICSFYPVYELDVSFSWLGPSYTSYSQYSNLPYCAFEWGDEGYAGCSNHGGELLYLSKPSDDTGLVLVRGHFATSLYASLSRSQIDFGGPSTFGLEVTRFPYAYDRAGRKVTQHDIQVQSESTKKDTSGVMNGSSFKLGAMIDRGCFNYRWPVTDYYLDLHPHQEAIEVKNKRERELTAEARQSINTIAEATEETAAGGNEGSSTQQQAQNMPSEQTGIGASEGIGAAQNAPNAPTGQNGPRETVGLGTQQQAPNTSAGEVSTEAQVKEKEDKHETETESPGKHVGTCQMFSCAMGEVFYQILRIEELRISENDDYRLSFPADSQIVLTIGGPVCK